LGVILTPQMPKTTGRWGRDEKLRVQPPRRVYKCDECR
jgi:hypothetical protein